MLGIPASFGLTQKEYDSVYVTQTLQIAKDVITPTCLGVLLHLCRLSGTPVSQPLTVQSFSAKTHASTPPS